MKILQPITVKQVLTEQTKKTIAEKYHQEIRQLEKEIQQLKFEEKKQLKNHSSHTKIQQDFRKEVTNRLDKLKTIEFQLDQLHILPLGTEMKDQDVLSIVDIQIGDNWEQAKKSIIVKDGVIIDIR